MDKTICIYCKMDKEIFSVIEWNSHKHTYSQNKKLCLLIRI